MADLIRRVDEPYVSLREAMDRLFEQSFTSPFWATARNGGSASWRVPCDLYQDHDNYYLYFLLPGVNPEDVQIQAVNGTLSISGEVKWTPPAGATLVWQEFQPMKFHREISFPAGFSVDKAGATYHNGLLILTLPKAESARARTLKVKVAK